MRARKVAGASFWRHFSTPIYWRHFAYAPSGRFVAYPWHEVLLARALHRPRLQSLVRYVCGCVIGMAISFSCLQVVPLTPPFKKVQRHPKCITTACFIRENPDQLGAVYTLEETLGSGAAGVVSRAVHNSTGVQRAVKRIDKQGGTDPLREVEAWRTLDHPNVCRLVEYFDSGDHLALVMELCRGQDLCDHIKERGGLPEAEADRLMVQILRAVQHCHAQGIIHGDLKPDNVVFSGYGDDLKLVDFGASCKTPVKGTQEGRRGTLVYMSPQALGGAAPSRADDVWSMGVMYHILLTGRFPFPADDLEFERLCRQGRLEEHVQRELCPLKGRGKDLAEKMLTCDAAQRISVEAALRHLAVKGDNSKCSSGNGQGLAVSKFESSTPLRRIAAVAVAHFADRPFNEEAMRHRGSAADRPYTTFLSVMDDELDPRLCRAAFDLLDADHDGVLSADDLQTCLGFSRRDCAEILAGEDDLQFERFFDLVTLH